MKAPVRTIAAALFLAAAWVPSRGAAQAPAQQQEVRYVTISTFAMPQDTMQQRLLMMTIDSVMVPQARMNPNVLSYRILTHNWGANSRDILIVAEYANWAAIEAECPACDQWLESKTPAAGSAARAQWDALGAVFARSFQGHADEIYTAQMTRAKK